MNNELIKFLNSSNITFSQNEPLKNKTTFKIGGNADLFITPETSEQLKAVLSFIIKNNIHYFILGGGSNIVFSDEGFNGAVISTQNLNNIKITKNSDNTVYVNCQSGVPTAAFVNFCTKNNLSGAEQFAGLPGSIGGAVFMNARCFDKSISDFLINTEHLDFSSINITETNTEFNINDWDYKKSPFQTGFKLITSATFKLTQKLPDNHDFIDSECKKYISERVDKGHFKYPSAGSVFKNNHAFGKPSGKIIDEAGLKGYAIGGAQIAPFHGNFIINTNNAKATDIKALVQYIQKIVEQKFGFSLEPEIIFVDK